MCRDLPEFRRCVVRRVCPLGVRRRAPAVTVGSIPLDMRKISPLAEIASGREVVAVPQEGNDRRG